jgi:cytochrome c6
MHRRFVVTLAILALTVSGVTGCKKKEEEKAAAPETTQAPATTTAPTTTTPTTTAPAGAGLTGEQLYKQHCAVCHPDGGNTINPSKPVGAKAMATRGIKSADDIVKIMRHPGPGMNKFDESVIPDEDARKIGEYMLTTFK